MSSTALVLATASDTAPMAMLPQRIGSGGSSGITGFSAEVSILPEKKKKLIKDCFPESKSVTMIKLYFSMFYLQMQRLKTEAGKNIFPTSTPEKFLSDVTTL